MNGTHLKTLVSWSTGKDSAWLLYMLKRSQEADVVGLLTTVNRKYGRVAMHAVQQTLLDAQADSIGLPVFKLALPHPCPNEDYERIMASFLFEARSRGVSRIAFGDLFLEDVRRYRESRMRSTGVKPVFPLWGMSSADLAVALIEHGFRMLVTCVDPRFVPKECVGREFDRQFLKDLPGHVDPCGENGEFHTFVFDGPIFRTPLSVEKGRMVERDGFVYADVVQNAADRGRSPTSPLFPGYTD